MKIIKPINNFKPCTSIKKENDIQKIKFVPRINSTSIPKMGTIGNFRILEKQKNVGK